MMKITHSNVLELIENLDVPVGLYEYVHIVLKDKIAGLYHPTIYAFPLTQEAEEIIEWMEKYHFDDKGSLVWQSINRYGAYHCNVRYDREIYNIVLFNND